jgi:hypothetical protein
MVRCGLPPGRFGSFQPPRLAFSQWKNRAASIKVEAVNAGRRPVILTKIVGYYKDGDWCAVDIREDKIGIRLQEHETFSEDITDGASLNMLFHPISHATLTDLWFEDTLGRQYRVKNAKKQLKRLFKDWNERNL